MKEEHEEKEEMVMVMVMLMAMVMVMVVITMSDNDEHDTWASSCWHLLVDEAVPSSSATRGASKKIFVMIIIKSIIFDI